MHSIVETLENGERLAVAVQTIWLKNGKLYWPPGKNVDRKTPCIPGANWTAYNYKLLKTGIETFEEALELEKMYEKHRNSDSFEEEQIRKKAKRDHPIEKISKRDVTKNKYHGRCAARRPLKLDSKSNGFHGERNVQLPNTKKFFREKGKENHSSTKTSTTTATSSTKVEQIGIASRKETASGSTGNGNHENAEEVFVTDNIHSLDLDPILPDNMIYIDNSDSIQSDAAFNTKFNNILDGSHFNRNTGALQTVSDDVVEENAPPNTDVTIGKHTDETSSTAAKAPENHSYVSLLNAVLEGQVNEAKERQEMEARIHSHLDMVMNVISSLNPIDRIKSKNSDSKLLSPPENASGNSNGNGISVVDNYRSPIPHCSTDPTVTSSNNPNTNCNTSPIYSCPTFGTDEVEMKTLGIETHTIADRATDDLVDLSSSESDTDSIIEVDHAVPEHPAHVCSDLDFESDADSIPEALPSKPTTEHEKIHLKSLGDKYRDEKNYMYSRNNVGSSNCVYLRCTNNVKYNCPARVIVKSDDAVLTIKHSHEAEKKYVDKARFYEKLAENCKLDPFEKVLTLHLKTKRQMMELTEDRIDESNLPNSKQTRSFIESRRKEYVPRLPATIDEFEAFIRQEKYLNRFAKDSKQLPFYRSVWESAKGEKSLVFISETVLKVANALKDVTLFMDGTFRALPYHMKFGQLYVINLIYKDHSYPLAYCLMERRTFTAYDSIFQNLKRLMPSVNVTKLMTDYEAATRKALRINYPNARLSGCFFHYVQGIFKYADKFNLLEDAKFKLAVQKVAALALLPNEFVELGFNHIDELFARKKSQRWTKFRNYWKKQWLTANISVYSLVDRTNNFSESSNKTLNSLLKRAHPNIWELIDTLKLIEMERSQDISKAQLGEIRATVTSGKVAKLNAKISMATKLFDQTHDVGAFLENITYDENLELLIKDHYDYKAKDDEGDENIIPNSFNIESDFRHQHPRTAANRK